MPKTGIFNKHDGPLRNVFADENHTGFSQPFPWFQCRTLIIMVKQRLPRLSRVSYSRASTRSGKSCESEPDYKMVRALALRQK